MSVAIVVTTVVAKNPLLSLGPPANLPAVFSLLKIL